MKTHETLGEEACRAPDGSAARARWGACAAIGVGAAVLAGLMAFELSAAPAFGASGGSGPGAGASVRPTDEGRGKAFSYHNDRVTGVPWSVHLLKLDRSSTDYELDTVLARNAVLGMETLSEQVKGMPVRGARPVGAVNGDFYRSDGDPEGIQVSGGELISAPSGKACFWVDAAGQPHMDEVQSLFRALLSDGTVAKVGLNEQRSRDSVVLYTPRWGGLTKEGGGRDYILEPVEGGAAWLPLHVGIRVKARVRAVREDGATPVAAGTMVLSVGSGVSGRMSSLRAGDVLEISTATVPELTGCKTAIGGGPRLVVDRKAVGGWRSPNDRHPRTAVGWNNEFLYLLLVDGRQPGLSLGMSFTELADYFIKLGCTHAVNLDGGGSASMWLFGQTVNSPSEGKERPVANGLVVVKKARDAARVDD